MNETDTTVQLAIKNNPGCVMVSLQSLGLCFLFSTITLLARTVVVKGSPEHLMASSMTILTLCPIFEFWFPLALYAWFGGSRKALVMGAVLVAVFNAVVMASWLDDAVASAG